MIWETSDATAGDVQQNCAAVLGTEELVGPGVLGNEELSVDRLDHVGVPVSCGEAVMTPRVRPLLPARLR